VTPIPKSVAALWSVTAVVGPVAVPLGAGALLIGTGGSLSIECTISGSSGDDVIVGTSGDDVLCGLEGNDRIEAQSGNDVLLGGPGDDHLIGGDGEDTASYEGTLEGVTADLALGTASGEGADSFEAVEGLIGSASDDVLRGSEARNILSGLGGTDLLFGQGGADTLLGGDGDDFLTGTEGTLLDGGGDTDTCRPGQGALAVVSCFSPSPPDENDTHGFLDVKHVDSFLETDEPVWRVVTISRWSVFRMWDRGFVLLYLDTFGGDLPDYYALIRSVGSRLRATLYRNGHRLAALPVWRRNRRSVSIRVPFDKLLMGADRPFYRWRVVTLTDRCRNTCFDRIPDDGAMVEPLQPVAG
jgi:Ca2+-binding RTX toxin-like protein